MGVFGGLNVCSWFLASGPGDSVDFLVAVCMFFWGCVGI